MKLRQIIVGAMLGLAGLLAAGCETTMDDSSRSGATWNEGAARTAGGRIESSPTDNERVNEYSQPVQRSGSGYGLNDQNN